MPFEDLSVFQDVSLGLLGHVVVQDEVVSLLNSKLAEVGSSCWRGHSELESILGCLRLLSAFWLDLVVKVRVL